MARRSTLRVERPVADPEAYAEKNAQEFIASAEEHLLTGREPPHDASLTSVAADAMRTGIFPLPDRDEEVPGQDDLLRAGDPDIDPLENLYNGDEMPGGSMPTPDQNDVDEALRAAGFSEAEGGPLRSLEEIADRRDSRPWEREALSPKE